MLQYDSGDEATKKVIGEAMLKSRRGDTSEPEMPGMGGMGMPGMQ